MYIASCDRLNSPRSLSHCTPRMNIVDSWTFTFVRNDEISADLHQPPSLPRHRRASFRRAILSVGLLVPAVRMDPLHSTGASISSIAHLISRRMSMFEYITSSSSRIVRSRSRINLPFFLEDNANDERTLWPRS